MKLFVPLAAVVALVLLLTFALAPGDRMRPRPTAVTLAEGLPAPVCETPAAEIEGASRRTRVDDPSPPAAAGRTTRIEVRLDGSNEVASHVAVRLYVESETGQLDLVDTLRANVGAPTLHDVVLEDLAIEAGEASLIGEVDAEGLQSRRARARASHGTGPLRIRLSLREGWTAEGQIVNAKGTPVPGRARIHASSNPDGSRPSSPAFVERRGNGRFAVHGQGVVIGTLDVDAGSHGAAYEPIRLDSGDVERELRAIVRGAGVITVVADEARDAPAAGLRLQVQVAGSTDGGPRREELLLQGGGHLQRGATTDMAGTARFDGLRAGVDYDVFATTYVDFRRTTTENVATVCATVEGTHCEIRLRRPHVRVRTVGEQRNPFVAQMTIVDVGEIGDPVQARGRAVSPTTTVTSDDGNVAIFEVRPGRQYLVSARGGLEGGPAFVEVPRGTGARHLDVRFARPRTSAFVTVTSPAANVSWSTVRFEDVDTGWAVASASGRGSVESWMSVPVGTYRLVVDARMSPGSSGLLRRMFDERIVEVKYGPGSSFGVELERGGRLEVELGRTANGVGVDERGSSWRAWDILDDTVDLGATPAFALSLWREGRFFGAVERTVRVEQRLHTGDDTVTATVHPQGASFVSDELPTGTFDLVATAGDGRRWTQVVTISPKEITSVTVPLD